MHTKTPRKKCTFMCERAQTRRMRQHLSAAQKWLENTGFQTLTRITNALARPTVPATNCLNLSKTGSQPPGSHVPAPPPGSLCSPGLAASKWRGSASECPRVPTPIPLLHPPYLTYLLQKGQWKYQIKENAASPVSGLSVGQTDPTLSPQDWRSYLV